MEIFENKIKICFTPRSASLNTPHASYSRTLTNLIEVRKKATFKRKNIYLRKHKPDANAHGRPHEGDVVSEWAEEVEEKPVVRNKWVQNKARRWE